MDAKNVSRDGQSSNGKWKDLFSSNQSAESGTKLVHFSKFNNALSYSLLENDLGNLKDVWKYCIVRYVAGKFPGFKALNHLIVNSWKRKASLTIHESGWLVYRFMHEEDKLVVLSGGPYLVYDRPLILKSMSEFFDFSTADMSTVPFGLSFLISHCNVGRQYVCLRLGVFLVSLFSVMF